MKNYDLLPPIILDLIANLGKDEIAIHTRDAYCSRLENIVACASEAVDNFRRKQTKHYTVKAKQKQHG